MADPTEVLREFFDSYANEINYSDELKAALVELERRARLEEQRDAHLYANRIYERHVVGPAGHAVGLVDLDTGRVIRGICKRSYHDALAELLTELPKDPP